MEEIMASRSRRWIVVLLATLGLAAPLAGAAEPVNLIGNGGFEEGFVGWTPSPRHQLVQENPHSGKTCLTGEVTGPWQALILRRSVPVKAGYRYRFDVYARATNGTKLVLWALKPGASQRQMIAGWEHVGRGWRLYTTALSVAADGLLKLEIVAPSSNAAPPGRIWLDDVALWETAMPPMLSVSADRGFNDEPAMARAADGSIYVAWNSFRNGFDSLQAARYTLEEKSLRPRGAWQILGGANTYLLGPRVVAAGEGATVVYAAEKDKRWDIYAANCGAAGPQPPLPITADAAIDVNPSAAWHPGSRTVWMAWESNRQGVRQIFAAALCDGKVSPVAAVSPADCDAYDPSVAVLASGEVCVAWHAFRENNYDIYLRRRSPAGLWGPERRLTRAPTVDRHGVLAARGDELWIVYENAQSHEYHYGATPYRRLIVARVDADGLMTPRGLAKSPLSERAEASAMAFDDAGRPWIAYLVPRSMSDGWDVFLTGYDGEHWLRPAPMSLEKGLDRFPGLIVDGDRAIVAMQNDDMPRGWADVAPSCTAKSNVVLALAALGKLPPAGAMRLEPLLESTEKYVPGELRVALGEDSPPAAIEYRGQTLKLFYGDLHHHTDVSLCARANDQSVEEGYQHMRDISRLDFACATDHGQHINPYFWFYLAKLARVNDDRDRFLTFLAEEWSSNLRANAEHPYGYYGHHNLILADSYFPRWWNENNGQSPADVWENLRAMNANFVNIPHQLADTGNVPVDWNFHDETAQPVAEIFQTRGSYEFKGTPREAGLTTPAGYFLQDAWARGIVIGVIASPDHGGGYGKACVYAPTLTREAILDALRARHCYGTTAAKIFLDVRVNGNLMGEKLTALPAGPVEVKIAARCPGEIERIDVCRNNQFVYTYRPAGRTAELTFVDRAPIAGRSYYYVRVIEKDREMAWSSPVWFGAK
jgi:hypothetical protein